MKVLVDTNVILDVLLKRTPFYKDSFTIFQLADSGFITGIIAAVSLTNVFYVLRKAYRNSIDIYRLMEEFTAFFIVAPVTEITVASALDLRWKDFEDAIQFVTAKENKVDFIITRNKADYESSDVPCMTPTEFIACIKEKEEAK